MMFEIPASVELRNALGGLMDIAPGSDRVLYAECGGELVPVATVSRYPDRKSTRLNSSHII